MRRTKIICTLGPASDDRSKIRELIAAGMDVARLNFSHGAREHHAEVARRVREESLLAGRYVALLQDLSGPKIRTGRLRGGKPVALIPGQRLWLTPKDVSGSSRCISVTYPKLAREVKKGNSILLSDGLIALKVLGTAGDKVETLVLNGGKVGERKGVNLPGVRLSVPAMTDKDEEDLRFGIQIGVDYIALSFVRQAADIRRVKNLLAKEKTFIPVLAKLEKPEALANLEEILAASNGVMVARGDLGVEMPPEQVPLAQKKIIQRAAAAKMPVITATQMLESMTMEPRPTRAEASDVANAIFDGTDAVMLSAETATGKYPIEAVQMMVRIASQADSAILEENFFRRSRPENIQEAISESVVHAAHMLDGKAIIVFTRSGSTARMISKYRPPCPVYAFCHDEAVARRAALYWGVTPFVLPLVHDIDSTLIEAEEILIHRRLVSHGDLLVVAAGNPGQPGHTDRMRLLRAGNHKVK